MPKTVKVAFIGSGGMAKSHVPGLKGMQDVELVGFCDVALERAKAMADEHGGQAFEDAGKMLDTVSPDCCYVLLPPFAHGAAEMACIEREIPFFVEKPINRDYNQAAGIAEAVEDKGLLTSAGYMNRYRKAIQAAKKSLEQDPAIYVSGGWIGGKPNPSPERPISMWWVQKAKSGGQFVEQVTHTVDIVRFLCGEVTHVSAFAAEGFNQNIPGYDIDDALAVTIHFANGGVANLHSCCGCNAHGGVTLDVFAGNIAFEFRGWAHDCKVYKEHKVAEEIKGEPDIFVVEDEAFMEAVRTGDPTPVQCTYADALKTLEITLAANASAEQGKIVKLSG